MLIRKSTYQTHKHSLTTSTTVALRSTKLVNYVSIRSIRTFWITHEHVIIMDDHIRWLQGIPMIEGLISLLMCWSVSSVLIWNQILLLTRSNNEWPWTDHGYREVNTRSGTTKFLLQLFCLFGFLVLFCIVAVIILLLSLNTCMYYSYMYRKYCHCRSTDNSICNDIYPDPPDDHLAVYAFNL